MIEWVQRNKETRLTTERAFELTVSVGRATCQVIPLCPPTCVCTLHGFKPTVCMHGGRAKVYPPTRTQGKAENTKNFFLTYWVICVRIKLHRTAKAARWTAKAEKIVLDILSNMWYNKDKLKEPNGSIASLQVNSWLQNPQTYDTIVSGAKAPSR